MIAALDTIPTTSLEFTTPPLWKGVRVPKAEAPSFTYVKVNYENWTNALLLDFDAPSGDDESPNLNALAWEDAGLPPNWISVGPTGKCHYWFAIEPIYKGGTNGPRLAEFARAVRRSMVMRMRADPAYAAIWTKNPMSPKWSVAELTPKPYRLSILYEAFGATSRGDWRQHIERTGIGRNNDLFETLRRHAMRHFDDYRGTDLAGWREQVLEWAREINATITRGHPLGELPENEIRSTARSVANWLWENFDRRGVMRLDPTIPLRERQALGADYVNERRRSHTGEAVAEARRVNPEATQSEIARILSLGERTIRTYWKPAIRCDQGNPSACPYRE